MKLATIIGARPQFIKAAAVSRRIAENNGIQEVLIHTGQHYDTNMSDIFFDELSIPKPDHYLGIGGGSHGAMTGRQLEAIEKALVHEKPDAVLVYGDTNSTLAGALAAVKLHLPVAHVEAGLRSFNRRMPEEINRILTDHAADLLFAPTETGMANLRSEGLPAERLRLVGDVMYDAVLYYKAKAYAPAWFAGLDLEPNSFTLTTIHRAENTDDPERLRAILDGLGSAGLPVVLPLHPRTRSKIEQYHMTISPQIRIVDPVGYLEMVWLEANARFIATDSGGVQKEAFFHGKPCLTLRDETEWTELVECGWNRLVGADATLIADGLTDVNVPAERPALYGAGDTANRIIAELRSFG